MKANEAPEKIYIERFDVDEEKAKFDKSKLFFDDIWVEEPEEEPSQNYVEYTRTDAFIEKACKWLQNHTELLCITDEDGNLYQEFINDFKKAMEE